MLNGPLHLMFTMVTLATGCVLCVQSASAQADASGWRWSFTPYAWISDTNVKLSVNDRLVSESEIEFEDVVDNLDLGFQGHFEGHYDKFGFFVDLTYLEVSDSATQHGVKADTDIDTGIYELAAVFNPAATALEGFSVFGGLRHIAVDQTIELQGQGVLGLQKTVEANGDLTDFMIGARYGVRFSEKWELGVRGDYSTGDTEGTWNAIALAGYRFEFSGVGASALLGYRYMNMELKPGTVTIDQTMSGPLLGMRIDF